MVDEINGMHAQIDSFMMINVDIQHIQRRIVECKDTFEILMAAFLHVQNGVIQPQLIPIAKIKDTMSRESLPDGLDFPFFLP
jgi:hypothetical protein